MRASTQITHIASKICPRGRYWRNCCSLAETQKVIETTGIGIKRIGGQPQQYFRPQPGSCQLIDSHKRVSEPFELVVTGWRHAFSPLSGSLPIHGKREKTLLPGQRCACLLSFSPSWYFRSQFSSHWEKEGASNVSFLTRRL